MISRRRVRTYRAPMCAVRSTGCRALPSLRAVCCCVAFVVSAGGTGAFHGGILGRATLGVPGFDLELSAIFHVKTGCRVLAMHKLRWIFFSNPVHLAQRLKSARGNDFQCRRVSETARHGRSQPISRLPASLTGRLLFGCGWQGFGSG
jgi:hypothetical protein